MSKNHAKPVVKWSGMIKVSGARFEFETSAVSEAEARNNGIAQYSRKVNMGIAQLRKYLKDNNARYEIGPLESTDHE